MSEEEPHIEDPEVFISGKIDNFFSGNSNKKKIQDIYDLSEIPMDSNKNFMDEEDHKEHPTVSLNQNEENSHRNFNDYDESDNHDSLQHLTEDNNNLFKPINQEKNLEKNQSENIQKKNNSESTSLKLDKSIIKNNTEHDNSLINNTKLDNSHIKTPKNEKNQKSFIKTEKNNTTPTNKEKNNDEIVLKTISKSPKNSKNNQDNDQVKQEVEQSKQEEENSQNNEKEINTKKEERSDEQKDRTIHKRDSSKTKKKKKTKKPTKVEMPKTPPLISIGIPVNNDDIFDGISNHESPDFLIREKKNKKPDIPNKETPEKTEDLTSEKIEKHEEIANDAELAMSLNLFAFLKDKNVSINDKFFIMFVVHMMLFDIILCIIELVYYSRTNCQDNQDHAFVYINFIFAFIGKLIVFNFINLEVSNTLPFDYDFPFLFPIILFGMFPAMQLPQFIYDYAQCKYRSPLYDIDSSYNIMKFIGATLLATVGAACILTFCFNEFLNLKNRLINCVKHIIMIFMKLYVVTLNLITLLLTFSQIPYFVPALFVENICFWFLVIIAVYIKYTKRNMKKFSIEEILSDKSQKDDKEKNFLKDEKFEQNLKFKENEKKEIEGTDGDKDKDKNIP